MSHTDNQSAPENSQPKKGLWRKIFSPWIFLILIVGLGAVYVLHLAPEPEEEEERARPPASVRTAPVASQTLNVTVRGSGTLEPMQTVQIKPEISGKLMQAHFQEGSFVPEGELLFEIEREKLQRNLLVKQAALEEARARHKNARRNYERLARLREQKVASEEEYDRAETELQAVSAEVSRLESEVALARLELQDATIYAPFSGFISEKLIDPGTVVSVGQPLATMYATDPLRISFKIPEKYSGQAEHGQTIQIWVAAFPDQNFQGEVHFVSPVVDEATRKLRVRALIDNPDHKLKPGSFASAELILDKRQNRPVIPETALVATREGYMVFVLDEEQDKVEGREIRTGMRKPGMVEITEGLQVGEQVIAAGHMALQDGSRVNVQETKDEDWPAAATSQQSSPQEAQQDTAGQIGG